jgi:hypothetical protein
MRSRLGSDEGGTVHDTIREDAVAGPAIRCGPRQHRLWPVSERVIVKPIQQRVRSPGHHDARDLGRELDHLGPLPRDQLTRSDLRIRLSRKHRPLTAVRDAVAPKSRRVNHLGARRSQLPRRHHDGVHIERRRHLLGRQAAHPRGRRLQPRTQHEPQVGRLLRRHVRPGEVDRCHRRE